MGLEESWFEGVVGVGSNGMVGVGTLDDDNNSFVSSHQGQVLSSLLFIILIDVVF